jgi:hypothetical protein
MYSRWFFVGLPRAVTDLISGNMQGGDGDRLYFDGCAMIVSNGESKSIISELLVRYSLYITVLGTAPDDTVALVLAQGSQFSL